MKISSWAVLAFCIADAKTCTMTTCCLKLTYDLSLFERSIPGTVWFVLDGKGQKTYWAKIGLDSSTATFCRQFSGQYPRELFRKCGWCGTADALLYFHSFQMPGCRWQQCFAGLPYLNYLSHENKVEHRAALGRSARFCLCFYRSTSCIFGSGLAFSFSANFIELLDIEATKPWLHRLSWSNNSNLRSEVTS